MSKIVYFEVEDIDVNKVCSDFPDAQICSDKLNIDNVFKYTDTEIIVGFIHSDFSADVLRQIPNLKLLITRSVGFNHIDLKYCKENNIKVSHVPDYGSHVIAEHVFALLLATVRHVIQGEDRTTNDVFDYEGLRGMSLSGKTLGIVGCGKIGIHVAKIASLGFGMKVLAFDVFKQKQIAKKLNFKYVNDLKELYNKSDIISLHVPLNKKTKYMICSESISKMKDGVILINTARGGLINSDDLLFALRSGKISYAALDVIEHENDLEKDHELLHEPNLVITPHIAFYTNETIAKMYEIACSEVKSFIKNNDLSNEITLNI